jgi:hypothetical protein
MSEITKIKEKFERVRSLMDERTCRLWAANESFVLGPGGEAFVIAATGLSQAQIHLGKRELEQLIADRLAVKVKPPTPLAPRVVAAPDRIRRPGGGRKRTEVKQPGITAALERLLADEIAAIR